ncbi:MAG: ParA family protein [Candidatus Spechtbacteria bacterium SB0662_bin_43]|uniref:ParA family protein n=1 Tax=Candidatus Spechtbacteria bacterium SB0662_bin_43 TaxID=2604897 RepID=A0A845DJV5_9BACT|nr:ParA family protein [Candidatus Spechtbacteria bacterium SB0662_bin_43]
MAYIITVCNQKGGVGKTSTAVNVVAALALELKKRVLFIDMDPQANASSTLNGRDRDQTVYHTLAGGILPEDVVHTTQYETIDLLPASAELAGAAVEMVNISNREFRLYDIIMRMQGDYDFIFIDAPPTLDLLTLNSIVAAHYVIIPVQCEYYAMEGLGQLLATIGMVKDNLGKEVQVLGAVCTMYDSRNRLSGTVVNEVRTKFPGYVFEAVIPRNVALAEAPGYGKTIFEFNPSSKGAVAYNALMYEIVNRLKQQTDSE